jgi:hypothetical protein
VTKTNETNLVSRIAKDIAILSNSQSVISSHNLHSGAKIQSFFVIKVRENLVLLKK